MTIAIAAPSRARLWIEFLTLFIGVPVVMVLTFGLCPLFPVIIGLALVACGTTSTPAPAAPQAEAAATPPAPDTFEPSRGVICDRDREVSGSDDTTGAYG